jgi:hypothetical protein
MPIGIPAALLIAGAVGAGGSVASAKIGSGAAKTAAQQQADAAQAGLDFQKDVFNTNQQNFAPFLQAGQTGISELMDLFKSGTVGPGSLGPVPEFGGAPAIEEARNTPGYQFTAQEGTNAIMKGAAAAGGAVTGGTLRALDQYNTGLADSTYNDIFNRELQTYMAQLQGFGTKAQTQQQGFNQLLAPIQIGAGAAGTAGGLGQQGAVNVGNLMGQFGNAQAAGTVGSANAIGAGIGGVTNAASSSLLSSILLPQLLKGIGKAPPGDAGVYGFGGGAPAELVP